jgi:hypothetical protein
MTWLPRIFFAAVILRFEISGKRFQNDGLKGMRLYDEMSLLGWV